MAPPKKDLSGRRWRLVSLRILSRSEARTLGSVAIARGRRHQLPAVPLHTQYYPNSFSFSVESASRSAIGSALRLALSTLKEKLCG